MKEPLVRRVNVDQRNSGQHGAPYAEKVSPNEIVVDEERGNADVRYEPRPHLKGQRNANVFDEHGVQTQQGFSQDFSSKRQNAHTVSSSFYFF
jgi:hypothetical protein